MTLPVLILTHGRADNVVTMKTLQRQGYSGKWYMVIDDEDDMADDYRRNFGEEHIVTFCKQEAVDRADTMDNLDEHRAILYARNESFRIARDLGLKYFLMLDDDYSDFLFRFPEGKKLASKTPRERPWRGFSRPCWASWTLPGPQPWPLPRAVTLSEV